ncbi:glycosyltransferase family 4 protein [Legionella fallonii]|uniref:Putative Glucosyltransferase n=1 Tax=Legionella fallonii LLAP-10 TaxID=1212491 RepID=A0A098G0X3_9GAMM|nr:glycosyltransferase family 4 protein [Legionella fallonii]CEG55624.1 putative Glucosyltransferase [Legionella fallonii LLAP-10]
MRIITVLDSYPPDLNGGAYFTHRLALSLQKRGHEILVICPSRSLKQGYSEYEGVRLFGVRSWPIIGYKHFRVCWPVFIKQGMVKAIKDFKPDLVHLQGKFFLGGICYRACRSMGIPLMATNHFMPENFFHYTRLPRFCEPWFNRICWNIVIDMLSNVDRVTTPTQTAAALLEKVHLKKPVHVISCGVDLQRFHPNQDASLLKGRFQIPDKPILLYCGRLDKEKNIATVVRAFHRTRPSVDAHLVIVGRGTERSALEELARSLGIHRHITFTDYLSDAEYPQIHGLADCFVNAGTAELQSIVVLEAIASGLPIIGAHAMALPELIIPGKNGYLFVPNDIAALANYMIDILSNSELRKRMGVESRVLAETHDINRTAEHYERLYQEMIVL